VNKTGSDHTFIMAAYDDLSSAYFGEFGYDVQTDRVVFHWNTETYYDRNSGHLNEFEIVLFDDGTVQWNFLSASFSSFGYDLFSGMYMGGDVQQLVEIARDAIPSGESWIVAAAFSEDCNGNEVPDECDVTEGTSEDCNGNGVPDECELVGNDCNANGVLDECDIAEGTSEDCNSNGAPDECDIADGTSTDVDEDGIPDECQRDVRIVAVPVTIDPADTTEVRYAEPEPATAVTRGSTYWIEVWASDLGDDNTGLTGVYVDVAFCEQTSAMAFFHGGIFTTFASGTIVEGGVDEFGGAALPSGGGIAPEWVRVGWIEMRADLDTETCTIALSPSSTGVARLYAGLVDWAFVELGAADLTIFAPEITYDLDGDGFVGVGDLAIFAGSWMQSVPPANADHDFDCDEFVGVGDLSWFATAWLKYVDDPTIQYPPPCGRADGRSVALGRSEDVAFQLVALTTPSASETTMSLPESISAVDVGATYYVEVWVSDVGDINTGLVSAYIDLGYPDEATVVSINHGSIFDLFTDGDVLPGLIDELGGSDLPGGVGIEPEWARVAVIELTADAGTSSATYTLYPSVSGVACYGRGIIPWPDIGLASVTIRHGSQCPGDLDGDGDVDLSDLAQLLAHYGMTEGATYEDGDLDGDGDVDLSDLAALLAVYGTSCD
jgi:hypothetical protein